MSFSTGEIELLYRSLEKGLGLKEVDVRVYDVAPKTVKITHKTTNNFFIVQNIGKYVMLVKPEHKNFVYTVQNFDEVLARLMQWQIDLM
jgi:hypothetical protein